MLIRNRLIALLYRILELGLIVYALVILILGDKTDTSGGQNLLYFGTECVLFTLVIVTLEVIFNAVDLAKNGSNGIAAYVYMPLTLAVLTFLLADALIYNISAPFLGGYASGEGLVNVILVHIILPIVFLFDYLLFLEKGTVYWRHALYWAIYPVFYFAIIMSAHYIFQDNFYPYPFLNNEKYQDSVEILSMNVGWNGVIIVLCSILLGFIAMSFLIIFINNVLALKYKRR